MLLVIRTGNSIIIIIIIIVIILIFSGRNCHSKTIGPRKSSELFASSNCNGLRELRRNAQESYDTGEYSLLFCL